MAKFNVSRFSFLIFYCFTAHFNSKNFILHQPMHFFHTTMYQSIKLILKPVKIFKTLRHVSISYEIILREFVVSLLRLLSFKSLSCDGFIVVMRQHTYGISALCALRSYLLIRVAFFKDDEC